MVKNLSVRCLFLHPSIALSFCSRVLSNGRCAGWWRGLLFNDIGPSRGEIEADFHNVGESILIGDDGDSVVEFAAVVIRIGAVAGASVPLVGEVAEAYVIDIVGIALNSAKLDVLGCFIEALEEGPFWLIWFCTM